MKSSEPSEKAGQGQCRTASSARSIETSSPWSDVTSLVKAYRDIWGNRPFSHRRPLTETLPVTDADAAH